MDKRGCEFFRRYVAEHEKSLAVVSAFSDTDCELVTFM